MFLHNFSTLGVKLKTYQRKLQNFLFQIKNEFDTIIFKGLHLRVIVDIYLFMACIFI